ncbi:MAG: response regulator [Nitrosomonas sp.]|nr:response regulator [Nitrosomonas sp.]MDP1951275.1 response regulator [Nitrosomonas sp.]
MNDHKQFRPINILMAEDNPTDVMLTKEALASSKIISELHIVDDGVEAIAFLYQQGKYIHVPRPDLILLDLNMPRKSGLEVLAELKQNMSLKSIPVIILTTSNSDEDIAEAYGHYTNCYIRKPMDFDSFIQIIQSVQHFWFQIVTLPTKSIF